MLAFLKVARTVHQNNIHTNVALKLLLKYYLTVSMAPPVVYHH